MRRVASTAVLLAALTGLAVTATPSGASSTGEDEELPTPGGNSDGNTVTAWVLYDAGGGEVVSYSTGSSSGTTWSCFYYGLTGAGDSNIPTIDWGAGPVWPPPADTASALACYVDDDLVHSELLIYDPANPLAGLGGAERARDPTRTGHDPAPPGDRPRRPQGNELDPP